MTLVGLYGALAASASVFIGILTALLASNLSNLKAEQSRIKQRIEAIDARLDSLDNQYTTLLERINEIAEEEEERRLQEEAQEQVEVFIDEYVGDEFDIRSDELTPLRAQQEFQEFLDVDSLNEHQHEVLQERYDEIREELARSETGLGAIAGVGDIPINPEIDAAYDQIEHQWQIHREERYNRDFRQWVATMTEIRSLQKERRNLNERYESLDPGRIRGTLRASVVTIILSIGVPLLAYLAHEIGVTIQVPYATAEPILIFLTWGGGLGYVFKHLNDQLGEEIGDLPDAPELAIDEESENEEDETEI